MKVPTGRSPYPPGGRSIAGRCTTRAALAARWAVFFDHLGIGWEYEPNCH